MSIRKRLASIFFLMITLLLLMGGVLYRGRPIIVGAFRQSIDAMYSLNAIRELRSFINTQKVAISRYLLLDDPNEKLNFEDSSRLAKKKLDELNKQFGSNPPAWYKDFYPMYVQTNALSIKVSEDYKRGQKSIAHEEYSAKLTPMFKMLFQKVDTLEKEKSSEADATFEKVQSLMVKGGEAVAMMFLFSFLFGIFLFRSLYRAVLMPLEILRKGTEEFGKGHWDHRIDLPSKNEFGTLAKSFNTMAENVKQLQMQAVHMDRMSAVGQLAGGVAHEINNPLTAVLGQAQILLAKIPDTDPVHASLKKIENAGLRCKKIVRGLLDFSRPSQISFEPIDVNEIVKSSVDLCEADLKRAKVNIEKRLAKALPRIQANSSELQQVLLNLINNAIQAMPRGGALIVETQTHRRPLKVLDRRKGAPPKMIEGPWVEVKVSDTGIGIAEEHINQIFEPFFTTKEIVQGTGLVLAVSMGIVQKHGGDLRVESDGLNRGATFYLTLPLKISTPATSSLFSLGSGLST